MFLVDAFQQLSAAFGYYFAHSVLVWLSLPIALVRVLQIAYRSRVPTPAAITTEFAVELTRLFQYILALSIGTAVSLSRLSSSSSAWGEMFAGIRLVKWESLPWDIAGFLVVFALFNAALTLLFRYGKVGELLQRLKLPRHRIGITKQALLLGIKNLLLIPVSVIYVFQMLHFL
ncbi:hypothetical protein [Paenibacillus koleovorans]|uniref:hypothetical protein n=1 Tax=Paenibacillus koleovorans TaxID=121608 RepID=UPI000FD83E08|nr:hypothetical protein [Paenibacillus koleovorans]